MEGDVKTQAADASAVIDASRLRWLHLLLANLAVSRSSVAFRLAQRPRGELIRPMESRRSSVAETVPGTSCPCGVCVASRTRCHARRDRVAVSVIVTVCEKRREVFHLCHPTHGDQSFDDYELVIVDNGCLDLGLGEVDDDRLRHFRFAENAGAAAGRNKGASFARGEIILFVDSDIRLPWGAIEELVAEYRRRPCDALMVIHQGEAHHKNFPSVFKHAYLSHFHRRLTGPVSFLDSSCLLVSREAWERHNGFKPLPTLEDYELGNRMAMSGATLLTTDRVKIEHLRRYSHRELLATDFARAIMKVRLMAAYRGSHADRSAGEIMPEYLYGVPLSLLGFLSLLVGGALGWPLLLLPLVLVGAFYLVNRPFIAHFHRLSEGRFRGRFLLFLALDMLVVGVGAIYGLFLHLVHRRVT